MIHRDIKPENILLHDGHALVADFGIALAVQRRGGARMTQTGITLGTPQYMSPEQAMGERRSRARSRRLRAGLRAVRDADGAAAARRRLGEQIIMKIIAEQAAPVTSLRKSVPVNVAAAVGKALEKLPADRFESARAFAGALHDPAFRHGDGAGESVPTAAARARARDPVFLAVAAVAMLGVGAALWGWRRAGQAAADAPRVYDVARPTAPPWTSPASRRVRRTVLRSAASRCRPTEPWRCTW